MLETILKALQEPAPAPGTDMEGRFKKCQVAVAALMVEAARLDSHFDESEHDAITRLVRGRFDLDGEEADALVAFAQKRQKENLSDWIFTKTVRECFSEEERKDIIRLLWEVIYADGSLHRFEDHMIRHVAGEIDLTYDDVEAARMDALSKHAGS